MPRRFIGTSYYVAAILPRDQFHVRAIEFSELLIESEFVTTEAVLLEVFNHLAEYGEGPRRAAISLREQVRGSDRAEVVPLTSRLIDRGVAFYAARLDKGYSLTDCISMLVCRDLVISEVLTHDHHFEQEGYVALMR